MNELYLAFSAISDIQYQSPSHCLILTSKELYIVSSWSFGVRHFLSASSAFGSRFLQRFYFLLILLTYYLISYK